MAKEIPVYLFVGFLESGKTKFIQETFEDPNFDSGDKTLLLICEEALYRLHSCHRSCFHILQSIQVS